ncbi:MAG: M20/M25/M40 family metallo-hydrolase [Chitinophagaceae bacterium]|nr:M20/M25/M40 family metallo-hydrolase [Chitinophagaceae bacterium]
MIKVKKVSAIEKTLAADEMEGRGLFTPGIDKAADYIAKSFKKSRLQPVSDSAGYFQEFSLVSTIQTAAEGNINGQPINDENIIAFTSQESLTVNELSGFEVVKINGGDQLFNTAYRYIMSGKSYIVWVDNTYGAAFQNLNRLKRERFRSDHSVVFILTDQSPVHYSFTITHRVTEKKLKNVVGLLPGKSKKEEYVIFSGHYDHLGIGEPDAKGDSVYNGANDDASGTTAVMMLARYFSKLKNNERTLVFAAFTAEETGGFGSQYFSQQFDPEKVMAMFNIEMIGTDSKWGANSAYITGYEKTDMGEILEKNLEGTSFKFHPDPYPDQQLFYRSDNATLALLGVPAHTISTSKMDSEPYYHTPGDEVSTLDLKNMTEIIKAIALSAASIVSGKDTPSRVDVSSLR